MKQSHRSFLIQLAQVNHAVWQFQKVLPGWIEISHDLNTKCTLIRIRMEVDGHLAVIGFLFRCFDVRPMRMRSPAVVDALRYFGGRLGHSGVQRKKLELLLKQSIAEILDAMIDMYSRLHELANDLQKDVASAYLFEILEELKSSRSMLSPMNCMRSGPHQVQARQAMPSLKTTG